MVFSEPELFSKVGQCNAQIAHLADAAGMGVVVVNVWSGGEHLNILTVAGDPSWSWTAGDANN